MSSSFNDKTFKFNAKKKDRWQQQIYTCLAHETLNSCVRQIGITTITTTETWKHQNWRQFTFKTRKTTDNNQWQPETLNIFNQCLMPSHKQHTHTISFRRLNFKFNSRRNSFEIIKLFINTHKCTIIIMICDWKTKPNELLPLSVNVYLPIVGTFNFPKTTLNNYSHCLVVYAFIYHHHEQSVSGLSD